MPTKSFKPRAACGWVAVALLWAGSATAGLHTICYEGPVEDRGGPRVVKMVVGCKDDSGAYCEIKPLGAELYGQASLAPLDPDQRAGQARGLVAAAGEFGFYEHAPASAYAPPVLKLKAQVFFHGSGETRACEVTPRASLTPVLAGHAEGVLTGFSTDASGLVTTGAWRGVWRGSNSTVRVPAEFIAVGGGVETAAGAFIDRARISQSGDIRSWESATFLPSLAPPRETTSHVIGLRIQGLATDTEPGVPDVQRQGTPTDLRSLVRRVEASTYQLAGNQPAPEWRVALPVGEVALGGDIDANATPAVGNGGSSAGQFAVRSAPDDGLRWVACRLVALSSSCPPPSASGWNVESLSELGRLPGGVSTRLAYLPGKIDIQGKVYEVRGRYVQATSSPGLQPAMDAKGLRGVYAVTGVGASLNWRRFTPANHFDVVSPRLTRIQPQLDLGGASAASAQLGGTATMATITTFALGIRLVPEGTPPDLIERPESPVLQVSWLCSSAPVLRDTSICAQEQIEELIKWSDACRRFPDMKVAGLCRPWN
jgi:hypothetical protein